MGRPNLAVDTSSTQAQVQPRALVAHQSVSSLSSMTQDDDLTTPTTTKKLSKHVLPPAAPLSAPVDKPPKPSLQLLFSLFTRRDLFALVLPAVLASLASASIPPFMSVVIGDAYDVFSAYQSVEDPTPQDNALLLRGIGLAGLEFCAMAGGALVLSGVMSSLWVWVGEKNAMYLRRLVYTSVSDKDMEWYDKNTDDKDGKNAVGAGGLMTQFASSTEDVRIATGLNMGFMVQHSCSIVATTIMAFVRSPILTVVILSTIPVIVVVQAITQRFSFQFYSLERSRTNNVSTLIDRAINAISTVKAFNAQGLESARTNFALDLVRAAAMRCQSVWAVSSGFSNFVIFSMFVQGFWFGAKLVKDGKLTPGDVLAVFWACLIAASTIQALINCILAFTRGKSSMVALITLSRPSPSSNPGPSTDTKPSSGADRMSLQPIVKTPKTPFFSRPSIVKAIPLQKIRPPQCQGEFQFTNVTFAYPSRPEVPVLCDVSMFLPSAEMTFIVGGSGSGKSTIAHLLLRLYSPQEGSIELDGRSYEYLDEPWTRSHVAAVTQGCVLFDGTVHENVALGVAGGLSGRHPKDVSREEVIAACRVALMHDFVRDLPDGYDTKLGNGGAALSGGQKQRLSIARAYLRNPTVLILDEATSALDATSRLLVFEAIKHWRKNKTTVVITHDLSQIGPEDFVYVLKRGALVEQGFRSDLEADSTGEFHAMSVTQGMTGGFLPAKDNEFEEDEMVYERDALVEEVEYEREGKLSLERKHLSAFANPTLPQGGATWLEPSVSVHGHGGRTSPLPQNGRVTPIFGGKSTPLPYERPPSRVEFDAPESRHNHARRSLTIQIPDKRYDAWRRSSLQITPSTTTSTSFDDDARMVGHGESTVEDDEEFESIKATMQATSAEAQRRRINPSRRRWDTPAEINPAHRDAKRLKRLRSVPKMRKGFKSSDPTAPVPISEKPEPEVPIVSPAPEDKPRIGFFKLILMYWPTIPHKFGYLLGLIFAIISGICTPIFGFFLSQLVVAITTPRGVYDTAMVNRHGVLVLLLSIGSGVATGVKYWLIEWVTMDWLREVRRGSFERIVQQDKEWFDRATNAPSQLLQLIMRDPEDAKSFISVVVPQAIVVTSMIGTGLIWAMIQGWQLTLVGIALGPVFFGFSAVQNHFAGKFERRNKTKREAVNKEYYDAVANVRAIRSMGFDKVFKEHFERALESAMKSGVDGGFVDGLGFGIANALIYAAQGLIYYVGAVFIAKGTYTFLQMIQVLNLVSFSLTIAAQMLYFVQRINKSLQALRDFERLISLKTSDTTESQGKNRWRVQGPIRFHDVSFAYPTRPEVTVLRNLSLKVKPNESVALVGASGSGKSTIAALIQRLYEPTAGFISVNGHRLQNSDVVWLREHMAIVSQQPYLFDASIEDNIGYGGSNIIAHSEIERAAKEANIHDFILSLPEGYNTVVGENASLISGGQAQRISIARALARRANILILDECTSALDAENQREVMKTIQKAKVGRTTLIVTHKLPMMLMADRIVVLDDGGVAEEGVYEDLMRKRGVFYKLATAGEWEADS